MNETVDTLNKAGETAKAVANDTEAALNSVADNAGTALNTVASGCSGLWDGFTTALDLALDGRLGDAYASLAEPSGQCYDSVAASIMGLFPFLS